MCSLTLTASETHECSEFRCIASEIIDMNASSIRLSAYTKMNKLVFVRCWCFWWSDCGWWAGCRQQYIINWLRNVIRMEWQWILYNHNNLYCVLRISPGFATRAPRLFLLFLLFIFITWVISFEKLSIVWMCVPLFPSYPLGGWRFA